MIDGWTKKCFHKATPKGVLKTSRWTISILTPLKTDALRVFPTKPFFDVILQRTGVLQDVSMFRLIKSRKCTLNARVTDERELNLTRQPEWKWLKQRFTSVPFWFSGTLDLIEIIGPVYCPLEWFDNFFFFLSTEVMQATDLSSSMESLTYETSSLSSPTNSSTMGTGGGMSQQQQQQTRTKRMRTSFKHHQLRTMKSYFNINQNPDAKDLKQLAQKTGLSKRVLQVKIDSVLKLDTTRLLVGTP